MKVKNLLEHLIKNNKTVKDLTDSKTISHHSVWSRMIKGEYETRRKTRTKIADYLKLDLDTFDKLLKATILNYNKIKWKQKY